MFIIFIELNGYSTLRAISEDKNPEPTTYITWRDNKCRVYVLRVGLHQVVSRSAMLYGVHLWTILVSSIITY